MYAIPGPPTLAGRRGPKAALLMVEEAETLAEVQASVQLLAEAAVEDANRKDLEAALRKRGRCARCEYFLQSSYCAVWWVVYINV